MGHTWLRYLKGRTKVTYIRYSPPLPIAASFFIFFLSFSSVSCLYCLLHLLPLFFLLFLPAGYSLPPTSCSHPPGPILLVFYFTSLLLVLSQLQPPHSPFHFPITLLLLHLLLLLLCLLCLLPPFPNLSSYTPLPFCDFFFPPPPFTRLTPFPPLYRPCCFYSSSSQYFTFHTSVRVSQNAFITAIKPHKR